MHFFANQKWERWRRQEIRKTWSSIAASAGTRERRWGRENISMLNLISNKFLVPLLWQNQAKSSKFWCKKPAFFLCFVCFAFCDIEKRCLIFLLIFFRRKWVDAEMGNYTKHVFLWVEEQDAGESAITSCNLLQPWESFFFKPGKVGALLILPELSNLTVCFEICH